MQTLAIGDVTITSIIERDGPWRTPQDMFPDYDPIVGRQHLAELGAALFDPTSGKIVITYQTFVVRTPKHTILIDTCTGEDKGYAAPMNFPKQPWLDNFRAAGPALRKHRLRVLHAPAHRPLRLEYAAGERALGADVSKSKIHLSSAGVCVLGSRNGARRAAAGQCVEDELPAGGRGRAGAAGG